MTRNKKMFYLVTAIICVAIVLQVMQLFNSNNFISTRIINLTLSFGLIFGFVYALENFAKGVAKYYKLYMFIYALSSLYVFVASIIAIFSIESNTTMTIDFVITLIMIVPVVCELLLTFGKNLGRKMSIDLSIINFVVVTLTTLFDVIFYKDFTQLYAMYIGSILLALITVIFVIEKYEDKAIRGTK